MLILPGANVNQHVSGDDTPLINAVRSNDSVVVRFSLDAGADPNLNGDYDPALGSNRTPLNQADRSREIPDLLRAAGARD
jgi:ankyrin repeat protein